jgi:uncharacterized protein YceK
MLAYGLINQATAAEKHTPFTQILPTALLPYFVFTGHVSHGTIIHLGITTMYRTQYNCMN